MVFGKILSLAKALSAKNFKGRGVFFILRPVFQTAAAKWWLLLFAGLPIQASFQLCGE